MGHRVSFCMETPRDFYQKLREEYADFQKDPLSSRHAINLAMTGFHLIEWVWAGELKNNDGLKSRLGVKESKDFSSLVFSCCHELRVFREIANGSKHFSAQNRRKMGAVQSTSTGGFGTVPFDSSPYDQEMLTVELSTGTIVTFKSQAIEVMEYWDAFFKKYIS